MKSYVSSNIRVLVLSLAIATASVGHAGQTFDFKYAFDGEKLSVSQQAGDYYQALEKAAKSCFHHFKSKAKSDRQKGIDLIDVCANPKSS